MSVTIKTEKIDMGLVAKFAKYHGMTTAEALEWCADAGVRRLATLDRNKTQGWAGKSDPKKPAPGRKGKGARKAVAK
jgi:hypothetical protein